MVSQVPEYLTPNDQGVLKQTNSLQQSELEALYAISQVSDQAESVEQALDTIAKIIRKVFIFDNIVLYSQEGEQAEAFFVKSVGRGRSTGADMAWGEKPAAHVIETGEAFLYQSDILPDQDRLEQHFILGLPISVGEATPAALIFLRFGGPRYSDDQINFATFIAATLTHLFERQQLIEKIASLEAEKKLTSLQDAFVAMVSHDLKTPLGFIKGYTTTLLRENTNWDQKSIREFLIIIDEETDRLNDLISNLIESSQLQTQSLKMALNPHLFDELCEDYFEKIKTLHPALVLQFKLLDTHIPVLVDSARISQVIDNIINNALKYAPESQIDVTVSREGEFAILKIKDFGPGIPQADTDRIFERFYRAASSETVRGSGLGLYICEQILREHHGSIKVISKPGEGAEFIVSIPIQPDEF